ncbi:MAG: DUF389 domain-containing protein [Tepidiformaceae bacterium]
MVDVLGRAENGALAARLERTARPDARFHLLIVFSCAIATLGLIADSAAVVIGAMLVAPLLTPLSGLALGSVRGRPKLLTSSAIAVVEGVAVAVILSAVIAWLAQALPFDALVTIPHEVQVRTRPNPFDLAIALAGGAVGAYALARMPNSDALPGVAIATALMPPLCTIGIGIALNDRGVWSGASLLFVTNLSAIVFAGIVAFAVLGFRPTNWQSGVVPTALAGVLVVVVAGSLVGLTVRAIAESRKNESVRSAVVSVLKDQHPDAELQTLEQEEAGDSLKLRMTVRTVGETSLVDVEDLQAAVAQKLQRRVSIVFVAVPSLVLDPLNPPAKSAVLTPVPRPPTPTPTPRGRLFFLQFQLWAPGITHD